MVEKLQGVPMNMKDNNMKGTWFDPDEANELTEEWFEAAYQYQGDTRVKCGRGRPPYASKDTENIDRRSMQRACER